MSVGEVASDPKAAKAYIERLEAIALYGEGYRCRDCGLVWDSSDVTTSVEDAPWTNLRGVLATCRECAVKS